jgi:hypothetical protein
MLWLAALCTVLALTPAPAFGQEAGAAVQGLLLQEGPPGWSVVPEGDGLGDAGPVDLAEMARLNGTTAQASEAALRTAQFREGYLRLWSAPDGRGAVALLVSSFGRRIDGPTDEAALLGAAQQQLGDVQRFETPELPNGRGLRTPDGVLLTYASGTYAVSVYTVGQVEAPRRTATDVAVRQEQRLPDPAPRFSELPGQDAGARLFTRLVFGVVFGLITLLIVLVLVRRSRRSAPPVPPMAPPGAPPPWSRSAGPVAPRQPVTAGAPRKGSAI